MQFLRAVITYILASACIAAVILTLLVFLGPALGLISATINSSLPAPSTNTPTPVAAIATFTFTPTGTPPPTGTPTLVVVPPTNTPTPAGFHPSPTPVHAVTSSPTFPITPTSAAVTPVAPTQSGAAAAQEELEKIDQALGQSLQGSIAYNAPQTMILDDTATIELLLNPSASPTEVGGQITPGGGLVVTASIEITPRMQAELIPADPDAFIIRPIHKDAEQLIGSAYTTRWAWLVTARKSGPQKLTMVIYRLVRYEGQDKWREVESYNSDIKVNVTWVQRLQALDWKWVGATLATSLLIPGFWRWFDGRRSKGGKKKAGRRGR